MIRFRRFAIPAVLATLLVVALLTFFGGLDGDKSGASKTKASPAAKHVNPIPPVEPEVKPLGGQLKGPGISTKIGKNWDNTCADQACLWPGSGDLGEAHDYVLLGGHSVTHGERFKNLAKVKVGDKLTVTSKGHTFTYRVLANTKVHKDIKATTSATPRLYLVTCASTTQHTTKRYLVTAEMVSVK